MEIVKGIGFFIFSVFILLNIARGIIPCVILIGIAACFFPSWYTLIITGLCVSACFGKTLSQQMDYGDRSMLQIQFGTIFDLIGNAMVIIGLLIGIFS